MPKDKNIFMQEFRSRPLSWGVQIVGVIVILLNVWLSTKLIPLAKSIDQVVARVDAIEKDIMVLEKVKDKTENILIKVEVIESKLNDVQARLERIDSRLAKHMGI